MGDEARDALGWANVLIQAIARMVVAGDEASASTSGPPTAPPPTDEADFVNCDHGDPTMFEAYWTERRHDNVATTLANSSISYFVESKKHEGGPWFVSAVLDDAVRELHYFVGNAVTEDKFIVAGTGSTQLFQAALYALASRDGTSTAVVSEAPYYSGYPEIIDYLQSKLFHWAGDSRNYKPQADEPFVEMVTTPNNPCGAMRGGNLVSGGKGAVVHDLAYYWPTYTPITEAYDSDIMLFSMSKCSGHAGLRVGWAVVKDPEVASKMAKFIEMNTIGLSQDTQPRAAGLMRAIMSGYEFSAAHIFTSDSFMDWTDDAAAQISNALHLRRLFHWGKAVLERRWKLVRFALAGNTKFSLPVFTEPEPCTFAGLSIISHPAFIWLKCEEVDADCQALLRRNGILARNGAHFGASPQYARVSLMGRDAAINVLLERLRSL